MSRSTHHPLHGTLAWQNNGLQVGKNPSGLRKCARAIGNWLGRQRARAALEAMTEYQLRDIGIARHEIPQALRGLAGAVR